MSIQVAQWVKNLPSMHETQVQVLGREDPLEEEMASQPSILAWRIPGQRSLAGCIARSWIWLRDWVHLCQCG